MVTACKKSLASGDPIEISPTLLWKTANITLWKILLSQLKKNMTTMLLLPGLNTKNNNNSKLYKTQKGTQFQLQTLHYCALT